MSLDDFANNLENCASQLEALLVSTYRGALQLLDTKLQNRIFDEHMDANGVKIGQYSTNPILIGAKSFRNKGQADSFFKSGEAYTDDTQGFRKTKGNKIAYLLPGGYKKLRAIQGMSTTEVSLIYTSELRENGIVQKIDGTTFRLVFNNLNNQNKARGYEEKHGKDIFSPSKDEADAVNKYIADHVITGMRKILKLE